MAELGRIIPSCQAVCATATLVINESRPFETRIELDSITDDQQRLRENLKALKGSAEEKALTQRYTQQLSDQETRLGKLGQEKDELEKKSSAAQDQLDDMIQELSMEVTL